MKTFKCRQLAVVSGIAIAMGVSGAACAAAIDTIQINSFQFGMGQAPNANDTQNPQINLDIVMGTFQGGPGSDGNADVKSSGIVGFDFSFFGPVSAYTIPDKLNDPNNPQLGVYPAPSGDITNGVMSLNLESWTAGWGGNEFNQGASTADGSMTISNLTDLGGGQYSFTADWSRLIEGGPFNGQTGYWTMDGTATVVPIPAAAWLMGSGLLGLVGVARRRRP